MVRGDAESLAHFDGVLISAHVEELPAVRLALLVDQRLDGGVGPLAARVLVSIGHHGDNDGAGSLVLRQRGQPGAGVDDEAPHRVEQRCASAGLQHQRSNLPDRQIGEDLLVDVIEAREGHSALAAGVALLRHEGVEAPDDVRFDRLHGAAPVEQHVEVGQVRVRH